MNSWCLLLLLSGIPAQASEKPALAVVEKVSGRVGFYTASGQRVAEVTVGRHPHEIILSPDKRLLYVTDNGILWMTDTGEGGNTISIIDVEARKRIGVIDLGKYRRPHGIDIHAPSGRMAVTIENPDGMLLIDPADRKVVRMYDVRGTDPHMARFDKRGEWVYVSNTASGTLAAVHLDSGKVKVIPTGARPQGSTFSHDGALLYLTNSEANSISIIDTAKQAVIGEIKTGKGPGRVALTPDGKTLVYNLQAGEAVGFADAATRRQTAVVALGGRPLSLTLSADGLRAYAGVQDQDRICVLSVLDRKIIQVIATPKGAGPDPALPLP
jgi:YVTN family beta-propeller protein